MKWAWIENNRIQDICLGGDPVECYHPEIAPFYNTEVPDDAQNGDGWVDGQLVKPTPMPQPEPPPVERTWSSTDIRNGLTIEERVKWDNDHTDGIKTAKIEFSTPQLLAHTTEVLQMLVGSGSISQHSMDTILS